MPDTELTNDLPPRPRAVLRVGFAGRKDLSPEAEQHVRLQMRRVLSIIGYRLAALTPGVPVEAGKEPPVAEFLARQCPLLRLVTGLCEGADAVAADELKRVEIVPDTPTGASARPECLETELAAVVPFDLPVYRESRPAGFRAYFDKQAARCGYILAIDGRYEKPHPDTQQAKDRRAKAYRAQSAILLRHSDIFVAATDPDEAGKVGGTLETVRAALDFELPVVFIHTGTGEVWLINPGSDLGSALAEPALAEEEMRSHLTDLVSEIVADPNIEINRPDGDGGASHGVKLLREYFDTAATPPLERDSDGNVVRQITCRERFWTWVEARFAIGRKPKPDSRLMPYGDYRSRATNLNYHYAGLYRGASVMNYALAVGAVMLAALSLVLLGVAHTGGAEEVRTLARAAGHVAVETVPATHTPSVTSGQARTPAWLFPVLLVLGVVKLGIVIFIARNTHRANHEQWNDFAVDYRYLAERLRALFYLPLAGSFQPPAAAPPQYASRVIHQSAADWLFEAVTRSVSPATLAKDKRFPTHDGSGEISVKILRLQPEKTVADVRDGWVTEQVVYHARNARTMERLRRFAEAAGAKLSLAVICVVAVDVLIVVLDLTHLIPHSVAHRLHGFTPWLVFLAAVLPAAVAALNGIRFQSECRRLAERSAIIRVILGGRPGIAHELEPTPVGGRWKEADALSRRIAAARQNPESDVAAWSLDTLLLTERIADDFIREAAEWSVLYAKELPET